MKRLHSTLHWYILFKICVLIPSAFSRGEKNPNSLWPKNKAEENELFKGLLQGQAKWILWPKIAECFIESLFHAHLFLSCNSLQFWLSDMTNRCKSNWLQLSVSLRNRAWYLLLEKANILICYQTFPCLFLPPFITF